MSYRGGFRGRGGRGGFYNAGHHSQASGASSKKFNAKY
jgi:hypothetical protein